MSRYYFFGNYPLRLDMFMEKRNIISMSHIYFRRLCVYFYVEMHTIIIMMIFVLNEWMNEWIWIIEKWIIIKLIELVLT